MSDKETAAWLAVWKALLVFKRRPSADNLTVLIEAATAYRDAFLGEEG